MKLFFLFSWFSLCCATSFAQTLEFSGRITDPGNLPIPGASVVLKGGGRILAFGYSDDAGKYSITVEKNDLQEVILEANSMGSEKQEKLIALSDKANYTNNFILEDEAESLSTVVISSDKKIDLRKDTIAYKVSRFTDETERTVEDVLKNLPGIEIDENGNIKAQGKNIQKILIEGDDLADSNYKVISQNLDAKVLDKVEVISNYDENPVLKQFLSSNAVVLNLKLQEDVKSVLFGNIEAGAGIKNRYLTDLNLGLIRPEIKFLNLGNLNNTGKTAGDQLNNYIFGRQGFNDFNESFEIRNEPPVYLGGSSIMIEDRFYIENNSLANNLLLNKTLKEKTKLRASLFFYNDAFDKEYLAKNRYFLESGDIFFSEENSFDFDNLNFSNDVEISHPISDNDFLNFRNSFKVLNENVENRLIFNNDELIHQQLKDRNTDLESNLKYTRKIKGGAAVFYLYLGSKSLDQDLVISPNTFRENTDGTTSVLRSFNESDLNYQGFQTNLIFKKNRLSYSVTGGILNLSEELNSEVAAVENHTDTRIDSLSGKNRATSLASNIKLKASYQLSRATSFDTNVDAVYTSYTNDAESEDLLFVNPEVNLATRTGIGNFRLGYSYDSEIPRLRNFVDNYLVLNYRALRTGTDEMQPISRQRYSLSYTFSRPEKRVLFNASLSYTEFEEQLVTRSLLSQEQNLAQFQYAAGQNFLLFNSGFTTYVDPMSSTLKLGLTHTVFESPAVINGRALMLRNQTSSIYFRGTSYFRGAYNFKFSATYTLNGGEIRGNEVSNDRYNVRLENILKISDRIFGNFRNELFWVESRFYETSTADIEFRPAESDWVFGIRAQNIFNTSDYTFVNVSDYQQSQLIYRAVPRYVLGYVKLRF